MGESISAYPLCWPTGWKRCTNRKAAQFSKGERQYSTTPGGSSWMRRNDLSVNDGTTRILDELRRMGVQAHQVIISTNVKLRNDGLPRSGERAPDDPGAAVYWKQSGKQQVMAIDRYNRVADNLAAIAATLEAMRAIERHGGAEILERAFTGFAALPAPGQVTVPWRQVLGLDVPGAIITTEEVERAYRRLRSANHPDKGGEPGTFHAVQVAYEQAQREIAHG